MRLGIMQGRLSPPIGNQIQSFPLPYWKNEFAACNKMRISCMEWIFDYLTFSVNPLTSDDGIGNIREMGQRYGVAVNSVIADYFMVEKLFGFKKNGSANPINMLNMLIGQCHKCGIPIVEIPLVDAAALKTSNDKKEFIHNMRLPLILARDLDIKISLETSLAPAEYNDLIEAFRPFTVYVNYDMGNSVSLGFDPVEEINLLGRHIINVHIKDRVKDGGTVPLGKGDVDFETVFNMLARCGYSGDFILQAARQDMPDAKCKKSSINTINEYINFLKPYMNGLS